MAQKCGFLVFFCLQSSPKVRLNDAKFVPNDAKLLPKDAKVVPNDAKLCQVVPQNTGIQEVMDSRILGSFVIKR